MKEEQLQFLRFALIGVASTALYFTLLIGLGPLIESIIFLTLICYTVSMALNFLAQGLFTFQQRRLTARQMGRYAVMHGCALVANSGAMAMLVDGLGVTILLAQVMVTGGIMIGTFLLSRNWVYARA